jgi:hypothetical protein
VTNLPCNDRTCARRLKDGAAAPRILGHTSYVMVMRYLHLDKGDLDKDFDLRSPFWSGPAVYLAIVKPSSQEPLD